MLLSLLDSICIIVLYLSFSGAFHNYNSATVDPSLSLICYVNPCFRSIEIVLKKWTCTGRVVTRRDP